MLLAPLGVSEMLEWHLVPTGVPGLVLHWTRVQSSNHSEKSYRVTAANGIPTSCTCLRFHFSNNDIELCSHLAIAYECPPVLEEV